MRMTDEFDLDKVAAESRLRDPDHPCLLLKWRWTEDRAAVDVELVLAAKDGAELAATFWKTPHPAVNGCLDGDWLLAVADPAVYDGRPVTRGLDCPQDGICQRCRVRPSVLTWVGEGGVIAWAHGEGSPWCRRCCLREQVANARKLAAQLPAWAVELAAEEAKGP